jgi:hypothetical protein
MIWKTFGIMPDDGRHNKPDGDASGEYMQTQEYCEGCKKIFPLNSTELTNNQWLCELCRKKG